MSEVLAAAPFTRREMQGALYWVLVVDWSIPLRWATDAVEVQTEAGKTIVLRGGLETSITNAVEWFGEVPGELQASFTGLRPPPGLNMGALDLSGHPLAGRRAELSQWVPGRSWEERRVVLRGVVRGPQVGGTNEPIAFTVRAERRTDLPKSPKSSERILFDTWGERTNGLIDGDFGANPSISEYYPEVFGKPGRPEFTDDVRKRWAPGAGILFATVFGDGGGSPAPYTITPAEGAKTAFPVHVLINNGPIVEPDALFAVNITKGDAYTVISRLAMGNPPPIDIPPFYQTTVDDFGQVVTAAHLSPLFNPAIALDPWVVGDEIWIVWQGTEGGTPSDRRAGALRTAGEVIEYILRTGSADVDLAGWESVRQELGYIEIDTYRNKPVDAWQWVSDDILPLIPVGVVDGPNGLRPSLWRWDAVARDAVGHIVAGSLGVERAGQPEAREDWTNEIRINYAQKTTAADFLEAVTIENVPLVSSADDIHPTTHSLASAAQYGPREAITVDATALGRRDAANRVALWMSAALSDPGSLVVLRDVQRSWANLPLGSVVLYSDPELGWTRRLAWVVSRSWRDTSPTMSILHIPDPARGDL